MDDVEMMCMICDLEEELFDDLLAGDRDDLHFLLTHQLPYDRQRTANLFAIAEIDEDDNAEINVFAVDTLRTTANKIDAFEKRYKTNFETTREIFLQAFAEYYDNFVKDKFEFIDNLYNEIQEVPTYELYDN